MSGAALLRELAGGRLALLDVIAGCRFAASRICTSTASGAQFVHTPKCRLKCGLNAPSSSTLQNAAFKACPPYGRPRALATGFLLDSTPTLWRGVEEDILLADRSARRAGST